MKSRFFEKAELDVVVSRLSKEYRVFGPVSRRSDASFQEIVKAEELYLDYKTTTLPPKKFFHKAETIVQYKVEEGFSAMELEADKPCLLFGVHPCDLNAMLRMDRFFSREYIDSYYTKRRENTVIIALNCIEPGENCFCASLGTGPSIEMGFDLLLTDIGNAYLVEVGTQMGEAMAEKLELHDASKKQLDEKERQLKEASEKFVKSIKMDGLAELAAQNLTHEVWSLIGEKGGLAGCFACLSCANCSLVCPTCYCYEVTDTTDISLKSGIRTREVDSCQLLEYSLVALGQNFRSDRKDRIRNWMICKFGGAGGQKETSCVGCGRCIKACPAHIDLTEVANSLWGE
jgi:sulfhydrogenase subunit beta (sulfur reductase)